MSDITTYVTHHLRLDEDDPIVFEHLSVTGADVIQARPLNAMGGNPGVSIAFHYPTLEIRDRDVLDGRDRAIVTALDSLTEACVRGRTAAMRRIRERTYEARYAAGAINLASAKPDEDEGRSVIPGEDATEPLRI